MPNTSFNGLQLQTVQYVHNGLWYIQTHFMVQHEHLPPNKNTSAILCCYNILLFVCLWLQKTIKYRNCKRKTCANMSDVISTLPNKSHLTLGETCGTTQWTQPQYSLQSIPSLHHMIGLNDNSLSVLVITSLPGPTFYITSLLWDIFHISILIFSYGID